MVRQYAADAGWTIPQCDHWGETGHDPRVWRYTVGVTVRADSAMTHSRAEQWASRGENLSQRSDPEPSPTVTVDDDGMS